MRVQRKVRSEFKEHLIAADEMTHEPVVRFLQLAPSFVGQVVGFTANLSSVSAPRPLRGSSEYFA